MAKKLNDMVIDMKAYGLLMESCWREAARIVSLETEVVYMGPPVGIKQVDDVLSRIDALIKNLGRGHAVERIAGLLFQAAIRDEEDQVADTV